MKKIITVLLAFSLSVVLIIPVHASDPFQIAFTIADVLYSNANLTCVGAGSADLVDVSDGSFQSIPYSVLESLCLDLSVNGFQGIDGLLYSGTYDIISVGSHSFIQYTSRNSYCYGTRIVGNRYGFILYAPTPATGTTYTTSPIAGAPGYFVTSRPRGTSGSGYAGDLAIPQANYMTILNSLQSLGGSATYYTALAVVDGETRYYLSCTYPSRLVTYVCNSSGQLYYYVKEPAAGGETGGGTVVPFDDTEVITAINSVYSAITSLGSRIGTLISSVDTISQNLAIHISNFVAAITSLRDDIDGFRLSMEYTFAEFTQLYRCG